MTWKSPSLWYNNFKSFAPWPLVTRKTPSYCLNHKKSVQSAGGSLYIVYRQKMHYVLKFFVHLRLTYRITSMSYIIMLQQYTINHYYTAISVTGRSTSPIHLNSSVPTIRQVTMAIRDAAVASTISVTIIIITITRLS